MEIIYGLIIISYILAVIAAHLSFRNWDRWKDIALDTLKARIFLDKSFLINNFRLSFVTIGIMVGLTSIYLIMEYTGLDRLSQGLYVFYFCVFPIVILSIVQVAYAYMWYKLLYKNYKNPGSPKANESSL
jgi:hypothetical protein